MKNISFSGRVARKSHEGGLLVNFEGRPPRLGARIRISGGKILGRVDTVIGPVGSPLIHILPLYDGIDPQASIGSPVEIAPRERSSQTRSKGKNKNSRFHDRRVERKGNRESGSSHKNRSNKGDNRGKKNIGKRNINFRGKKGISRVRSSSKPNRVSKGNHRGSKKSGRRTNNSHRSRDSSNRRGNRGR